MEIYLCKKKKKKKKKKLRKIKVKFIVYIKEGGKYV